MAKAAKRTRKPVAKKTVEKKEQDLEQNLEQDLEHIEQKEIQDQEGQQAWQRGKGVKCGKNESE